MENKTRHFQTLKTLACAASTAALALFTATAEAAPVNVALASNGGVATQSSVYGVRSDGQPTSAEWAIDGNTSGNWPTVESMSHTDIESQPWWQVSLGGGAGLIQQIDIWNRTDCCASRLNDFNVAILHGGTVVWQSLNNYYLAAMPEASFYIPSVLGDTVRISLNRTDYLSLAEVQVWTGVVPEPGSMALVAMGLGAVGFTRRRAKHQA